MALWISCPSIAATAHERWLDAQGRANEQAHQALQLLHDAADDGLHSQDYGSDELQRSADGLASSTSKSRDASMVFASSLDIALLQYLRDLRHGRVDPRAVGYRMPAWQDNSPSIDSLLDDAVSTRQLMHLAAQVRPRLVMYTRLQSALAHYRRLAMDTSFHPLPSSIPVAPGDPYPHALRLHQRLVALGDLPPAAPEPGNHYDGLLADGVMRFQQRHGLAVDGVIGKATLSALNVSPAVRVSQLELALERLRWLPDLTNRRFIGINIPMFRLWAYDPLTPGGAPLSMGVVVGRALDTRTPVLSEHLRRIEFRPYWNVPRSILLQEVLPVLERDPTYLQRRGMEIVRTNSDRPASLMEASSENLASLRAGILRLRQRPGPTNSLGLVKFVFPNPQDIYLHGTPSVELFGRPRRDFSHGCIRLEDPAALAQWVLKDDPAWSRERIESRMQAASSSQVELPHPVPVILFYVTAMVMPDDHLLHFSEDLYGHDRRLTAALKRRHSTRHFPPGPAALIHLNPPRSPRPTLENAATSIRSAP